LAANGQRASKATVTFPYYGAPVAEVSLATSAALASPVTLTLGNLTAAMAVAYRPNGTQAVATFAGVTSARLVGGAGGWRTPVALTPYDDPAGVLLSHVLGDLAHAAVNPATGAAETVNLAAGQDKSLGRRYVPETGAAAGRILAALAGPLWWIDVAGVTQVAAARPATTIRSAATVEMLEGADGWARVATEDPAAWMPGATFTGPTVLGGLTVTMTRIVCGEDGIGRVEVLFA
jgi:hypothetical protein